MITLLHFFETLIAFRLQQYVNSTHTTYNIRKIYKLIVALH